MVADRLFTFKQLREEADYGYPVRDEAFSDWEKNWEDAKLLSERLLENLRRR